MDVRAEIHAQNRRIKDLEDLLAIKINVTPVHRAIFRGNQVYSAFVYCCLKYKIQEGAVKGRTRSEGEPQKRMMIAKDLHKAECTNLEIAFIMEKDIAHVRAMIGMPDNYYDLEKI